MNESSGQTYVSKLILESKKYPNISCQNNIFNNHFPEIMICQTNLLIWFVLFLSQTWN